MILPTEEQCLNYFEEYKVPRNIKEHCLYVRNLAIFLAEKLKEKDVEINVELVGCTALLHDLFKAVTIEDLKSNKFYNFEYSEEEIDAWKELRQKYAGMHECEVAYLIFKEDYPELAKAIRDASNPLKEDKDFEGDIIHYADWRVFNNQIVLLHERLEDLEKRYPRGEEYWKRRKELIAEVEKKIFSYLNFKPEELAMEMKKMNEKYPSPVVGAFIFNNKNEILLCKAVKWNNLYTVPGGHVELGETIEQAVKREVKEETNLDIDFVEVFNVQDNLFDKNYTKNKHMIFLDCLCKVGNSNIKLDERELTDWRWFTVSEVLSSTEVPESVKSPVKKFMQENGR